HRSSMPDSLYACQGIDGSTLAASHSLDTALTGTPTESATVTRRPSTERRRDMRGDTVRTMRWVIVGFGALAGVVLLAVGATLIGAILLVMAVLRAVLLVAMRRRGRPGGRSGPMLQRLARNE